MKSIFFSIAIAALTITCAQAQVSDSAKRTQSRRPTINQSQEDASDKELLELKMNRKRNKGAQADTSATGANARKQPGENKALKNDVNQAEGDNNPNSPTNSNAVSIFETGTSSAGSPSTISDDNGKDRDGTNTVQRSTPNMAGSPAPRRGSASASSARSEKAAKNSNDKQNADVKSDEKAVKDKDKGEKAKDDKNKDKDKEAKDKKGKSKKKDKDSSEKDKDKND
jgi:hypothetical protein